MHPAPRGVCVWLAVLGVCVAGLSIAAGERASIGTTAATGSAPVPVDSPPGLTYAVSFRESGLPSGTAWTVLVDNGLQLNGSSASLVGQLPNGTYSAFGEVEPSVTVNASDTSQPYAVFSVAGAATSVPLPFSDFAAPDIQASEVNGSSGMEFGVGSDPLFVVAATGGCACDGGADISYTTWTPALSVATPGATDTISIGTQEPSYPPLHPNVAAEGAFLNYGVGAIAVQTLVSSERVTTSSSNQSSDLGGASTSVDFSVGAPGALVLLLVGVENAGGLKATGAPLPVLGDRTFSEAASGGDRNATVGIYGGVLAPGSYSESLTSYENFQGGWTAIGAAVYVLTPEFGVEFRAEGLPQGTPWWVNITGGPTLSSRPSLDQTAGGVLLPGEYSYTVGTDNKRFAAAPGEFGLSNSSVVVRVPFAPQRYSATFTETGLPAARLARDGWTVAVNGTDVHSYLSTIVVPGLLNGSYEASLLGPSGYVLGSFSGDLAALPIHGATEFTASFARGPTASATFTEHGLPRNGAEVQRWCLELDGDERCAETPTLRFANLTRADYEYQVVAPLDGQLISARANGLREVGPSGTVRVSSKTDVSLTFAYRLPLAFTESGLPAGGQWSVTIGGVTISNSTGSPIVFPLVNGTYRFRTDRVPGYSDSPSTGRVRIAGGPMTVEIGFAVKPGRPASGIDSILPPMAPVDRRPS